jgi:hypothetical protein
MAYQSIGRGTSANDGTGDDLRTGAGKVNANFVELYTYLGTGSALSADPVVTLAATQTLTGKTITGTFTGNITGDVTGNVSTTSGNLQLNAATQIVEVRGDGSATEGQVILNCETNAHGQTIKPQPHSAAVTNTMLLPAGANSTLVSEIATQTLTNKTIDAASNTLSNIDNTMLTASAGITNAQLANNDVTIGTTAVALGASATTITGLTSVTSTNFVGDIDGVVGGTTPAAGSFTTASTSVHFQAAVHADTTARDAAITSPAAGMVAYLTATNKLQVYTGSAWETITSA